MTDPKIIFDDGDLAELEGAIDDPDLGHTPGLSSTEEPDRDGKPGIEFFVQLHNYQLNDIETAIIHSAAQQILGRYNEREIAKQIEERCIELLSTKINEALEPVIKDALGRPMLADPYSSKGDAVTVRDYVGLVGRDFLEQRVDREGRPDKSHYSGGGPRIQWLTAKLLHDGFRKQIEQATNEIIRETRLAFEQRQKELLNAEKQRIRDAFETYTKADQRP